MLVSRTRWQRPSPEVTEGGGVGDGWQTLTRGIGRHHLPSWWQRSVAAACIAWRAHTAARLSQCSITLSCPLAREPAGQGSSTWSMPSTPARRTVTRTHLASRYPFLLLLRFHWKRLPPSSFYEFLLPAAATVSLHFQSKTRAGQKYILPLNYASSFERI